MLHAFTVHTLDSADTQYPCEEIIKKIAYNRIEIRCCAHSDGKHVRISHIACASENYITEKYDASEMPHNRTKTPDRRWWAMGSECGKVELISESIRRKRRKMWSKQPFAIFRRRWRPRRHNQFHRDAMCRNTNKKHQHSFVAQQYRGLWLVLRTFFCSHFPPFFSDGWFPRPMCCLLIVKCTQTELFRFGVPRMNRTSHAHRTHSGNEKKHWL